MKCSRCQRVIPPGARFCGFCGAGQLDASTNAVGTGVRETTPAANRLGSLLDQQQPSDTVQFPVGSVRTSPAVDKGTGSARSLALDFEFPVPVWDGVDEDCTDALEVYETCVARQWAGREQVVHFGYFKDPGGGLALPPTREGLAARVGKAVLSAASNWSTTPRYFYRESMLRLKSGSQVEWLRIEQTTYLCGRTLFLAGGQRTKMYPPGPIANFVVGVVPGAVVGRYACTAESGQFVAYPIQRYSERLLSGLNRELRQALLDSWSLDWDMLEGDRYERLTTRRFGTTRWVSIGLGESSVEPIFAPTLFQTTFLNPAAWYGRSDARVSPAVLRARELCFGIFPYLGHTLIVWQYPTPSVYARQGVLAEANLSLDVVASLMERVVGVLSERGDESDDSAAGADSDGDEYFGLVGQVRRRPKVAGLTRSAGDRRSESVNRPVLPLELAMRGVRAVTFGDGGSSASRG